jgi:oxaloacetate decarboxylase gamma subunit
MLIYELLEEGLQLMVFGMGVVFLFLGLLVGMVLLISYIIQNIEARMPQPVGMAVASEDDLLKVITAAVQRYRSDHLR